MNWAMMAGLLGGLYGFCLYIIRDDREFKIALTREEKSALAKGQIIDKIHKGCPVIFGNPYYVQGPLRVKPIGNGKPIFEPYGDWKQVSKKEGLIAEWTYTGIGREVIQRSYFPDGSINTLSYTVPTILNGDSLRDTRIVYFVIGKPTDTLVVSHWFENIYQGKTVKTSWSYDTQGKRPVPQGWKFNRY